MTADERRLFRDAPPCGLILFRRNCTGPAQIRALVDDFRQTTGEPGALVLIDQEGGRVQRLGPPHWRRYPPAGAIGRLYQRNRERGLAAARLVARLIACDLNALGITVNCAPVLDIPVPGADAIIGDRAYGEAADQVAALGRAAAEGMLQGGVLPVIKHIPGHGRAGTDSHEALPVIDAPLETLAAVDFRPFAALSDLPLAMTAHVLMPALDGEAPASVSPPVVEAVIRGLIGFDGLLMCDDLVMNALCGTMAERTRAVLQAGCDVALHCSGVLSEMEAVAEVAPALSGAAARRFAAAVGRLGAPQPFDAALAEALLGEVLAEIA